MDINYERISDVINQYAINQVNEILDTYREDLPDDVVMQFEKSISENRIVIVDKPNEEDLIRFNNNVPSAHGPRTKNDGYIHIYPYKYRLPYVKRELSDDEIINRFINEGIITHEIFHYLYKLDKSKDDEEGIEVEFGHFITEGMVQLKTEEFLKKKCTSVEYRKNIEFANEINDAFKNAQAEKLLVQQDIKNACIISGIDYDYFINKYQEFIEYNKNIEAIAEEIAIELNIDKKIVTRRLKRLTTEETIQHIKDTVQEYLPNRNDYYLNKLDEIQNKKGLHL